MKSNYKRLGDYIQIVDDRNKNLNVNNLLGVSITKQFIPSIANTVGTDLSNYKIVRNGQFAYGPVTSRNGEKISIALLNGEDCIISSSYTVFEIRDKGELCPEYLMLWFNRPEFDRYARFRSHGSVREIFDWDELCDVKIPLPSYKEQMAIIQSYKALERRITIKRKINDNLDAIAQTVYQQMFEANPDRNSWTSGNVGDVIQLQRGHDLPRSEMNGGDYPVAGSTGTIGYHDQYTTPVPAIVMGRSGNIGNPRLYLCNCWAHNTSLYVKDYGTCNPFWAFYMLKNLNYEGFKGGSAVPTLNRNDIHSVNITIPPEEIQKSFADQVLPLITHKERNQVEISALEDFCSTILATISSR